MKARLWLLACIGLAALLVPLLPLADPAAVDLERALQPPSAAAWLEHGRTLPQWHGPLAGPCAALRRACFGDAQIAPLLGTDALGRCVLARIANGARISLLIALVASLASLSVGTLWGASAGLAGGRGDQLLMRGADILGALPLTFLVIFVVALLRSWRAENPESSLDQTAVLLLVTAVVSWIPAARMVRAEVLSLRSAVFVDAARLAGATPARILRQHILPNTAPVAIAVWTLTVPRILVLESFLSFLGLGVEAPGVSWGLQLRQGCDALTAVHASWWLIVFPGLALALTLLLLGSVGEALRVRLQPGGAA